MKRGLRRNAAVAGAVLLVLVFAAYQQGCASRYPGPELTIILTEAAASVTPTMPNFVPLR